MYHANIFPLSRSDPIPVYEYTVAITPTPANRPQAYQILGGIAKRITNSERVPVIGNQLSILSMNQSISSLGGYFYEIPEVGRFNVELAHAGNKKVTIREFEAYSHLVNRLVDMALTVFAEDYYKFHPDSPYILRDEPYFDQDLISKTGILDAKRYYRGVHLFKDKPCFVLNRETQLRSNGNLLTEIRSLRNSFEETRGEKVDIDNPLPAFVEYINSLLRNKTAEVKGYPGPSVKRIKEVTWRYRARDTTPGSSLPQTEYFRKTYGITGLDPLQPLVAYEIDNPKEIRYQIPELLWIGHDFHDLERRIPKWRRPQVWGILHPDCKNQLTKIFEVLTKVNSVLGDKASEVYPGIVEIASEPLDISESAARVSDLKIAFGNKEIAVKHPFDTSFYHQYSRKPIMFAKQVPSTSMLVVTDHEVTEIEEFIHSLQEEFQRRNGSVLEVDYSTSSGWSKELKGHDVILTIGDDSDSDDEYRRTKELIQNK